MFDWNAFSTSAVATPSAATPATIHIARLVLGFKVSLLLDHALRARPAREQDRQLQRHRDRRGAVRHPQVVLVVHSSLTQRVRRSRSRMIERTRVSAVAIEYIQKEKVMSSIAVSIATCMVVPVSFTLEPWCSVFHQCTEK